MNSVRQQLHAVSGSEAEEPELHVREIAGGIATENNLGSVPHPEEITTMAGSDTDVPKPRLMLPRIRIDAFIESEPFRVALECAPETEGPSGAISRSTAAALQKPWNSTGIIRPPTSS